MKSWWKWSLVLLVGLCVAAGVGLAQGGAEEEGDDFAAESAEASKRISALVRAMKSFVGEARLAQADVSMLLEHGASFEAIDPEGDEDEASIEEALEKKYEEEGVYDFSVLLQHPAYRKWVAKTGVDGTNWMRKYLRASMLFMREDMAGSLAEMKAEMPRQLAELERMRAQMGEQMFQQAKAALEQGMAMAQTYEKFVQEIPEPNEEEKRLLDKHGKKLRETLGQGDDFEEDEGWEEMEEEDPDEEEDGE